jgi:hypothetical protein
MISLPYSNVAEIREGDGGQQANRTHERRTSESSERAIFRIVEKGEDKDFGLVFLYGGIPQKANRSFVRAASKPASDSARTRAAYL